VRGASDLLDWWTVPGARWGVRNIDFKIELKRDGVASPVLLEGYSEEDLAAFDGGDWQFVIVRVVPVDRDLTDLVSAERFIRGVDWGDLPQGRIDREDVTDAQAKELAIESVRALRSFGVTVETERDSEFAIPRITAPF
jgi:hypothetical protein